MTILNLIHLRATCCPFYPAEAIQQIMAYGHTAPGKEAVGRLEPPIDAVVAHLYPNDGRGKKILQRLRANFPDLPELPHSNQEKNQEKVVFSRGDLTDLMRASSSHFARLIREEVDFPKDWPSLPARDPSQERERRSTFAMAACIYNEPGTLHSILSSLPSPDNENTSGKQLLVFPPFYEPMGLTSPDNENASGNVEFDLNIEYLRAEDLRIAGYYAIEIYGTYTTHDGTTTRANIGGQNNICGIVFYGEHDSLVSAVGPMMQEKLDLRELTPEEKKKILKEAYGSDGPIGEVISQYVPYRPRPKNRSQRLPTIRSCPISRGALCPTLKNPTKGNDHLRAKIHVLIRDVPGALCKTLELIGAGSKTALKGSAST